jgi:DGQHR domain-containing protein
MSATEVDGVRKTIMNRLRKVRTWRKGAQNAPHKPLLLLFALSRLVHGRERLVAFSEIEPVLRLLLKRFDPTLRSIQPEYPFWCLQKDGLWEIPNGESMLPRRGGTDPPRKELVRTNAFGGLPEFIYKALRQDPSLQRDAVTEILNYHIRPELHDSIRSELGLMFLRPSELGVDHWELQMAKLRDRELEDVGHLLFGRMGLTCIHRLSQSAKRVDIDPSGTHHKGENLEIDYLIPIGHVCLVGEITSRSSTHAADKYERFRQQFGVIRAGMTNDYQRTCRALGIPPEQHRLFRNITHFGAFYILTEVDRFGITLQPYDDIAVFYGPGWQRLHEYTVTIGSYAQHAFLDPFHLDHRRSERALTITREDHKLNLENDRCISSGVGRADIFSFNADPYDLLPLARVFRLDDLTSEMGVEGRYQRALRKDKLRKIRQILTAQPDFMFPNSILVVLSTECRYRLQECQLEIAGRYGAITIIDGQHRLFSYADELVKEAQSNPRIPVTAIRFLETDESNIRKYCATTFVEINANQTRIASAHIDVISYPILGRKNPDSLAAAVLLQANERARKPLFGLFKTATNPGGIIQPRTVIKALARILNLEAISRLLDSDRPGDARRRSGYEMLFGVPVGDLVQDARLVAAGVVCVERYFGLVKRIFSHDWPVRGADNQSSLSFAKVIAGFVMLLNQLIAEGSTWTDVERGLGSIRENICRLRRIQVYAAVLFEIGVSELPDANVAAKDDFRFLNSNRTSATSMLSIVQNRRRSSRGSS